MIVPTKREFCEGVEEFEKREKRDAMYKVATFLVSYFWGKPSEMADGLGVLLLTWNQAFYRYGFFDFDELEKCIIGSFELIDAFRKRNIFTLSNSDNNEIQGLFSRFLQALEITTGKSRGKKSPVAASKALHLLAPDFFPLWDDKIARAYNCYYAICPDEKYISFCNITKAIANEVQDFITTSDKSLIKLIDQYNYSKYTKQWI